MRDGNAVLGLRMAGHQTHTANQRASAQRILRTQAKQIRPNRHRSYRRAPSSFYGKKVCVRSKAWLAAACGLQLARLPPPASKVRRSRRLRDTLAAAPSLLAHASVTETVAFCPMDPKRRYTVGREAGNVRACECDNCGKTSGASTVTCYRVSISFRFMAKANARTRRPRLLQACSIGLLAHT